MIEPKSYQQKLREYLQHIRFKVTKHVLRESKKRLKLRKEGKNEKRD